MRTILFIIQKEFRQIFRNKAMLPIIFILPFVLLILSNAASFEVKTKFSYIDHDHSTASRLISKFQSSDYFKIIDHFESRKPIYRWKR
jgi:ABC-2 type transport system permease protein